MKRIILNRIIQAMVNREISLESLLELAVTLGIWIKKIFKLYLNIKYLQINIKH